MTKEKWSGNVCTPPDESVSSALSLAVICAGRQRDPPGRVWAYGSPRDPAWQVPVQCLGKDGQRALHSPTTPTPTTQKAHSPNSKGRRKQSLHGKAFHKWGLWVSPSPCTQAVSLSHP